MADKGNGNGGFVVIGPFPVAFGSMKGPEAFKVVQVICILLVFIYAIWLFYLKK